MVDPLTFLAALAAFGVFADKLADLLEKLRAEKIRRNNEAAQYFEDLSAAMTRVVEGLRANRIPRIDGNEMQDLIHAFPEKTQSVSMNRDPVAVKAALEQAASVAKTLDGWLLMNVPTVQAEREQMLALIERITGACRAIAGLLKKPA